MFLFLSNFIASTIIYMVVWESFDILDVPYSSYSEVIRQLRLLQGTFIPQTLAVPQDLLCGCKLSPPPKLLRGACPLVVMPCFELAIS